MSQEQLTTRHSRFKAWWIASLLLVVYDLITVAASYYLALALRFESLSPRGFHSGNTNYYPGLLVSLKFFVILCVLVYFCFRLYNSIWKFASYHELTHCIFAVFLTLPFHYFLLTVGFGRMPLSYYVFGSGIQLSFLLFSRFIYRVFYLELSNWQKRQSNPHIHHGMLIGAGSAGQMILRDISTSKMTDIVIECVIDDDADKWGRTLDGIPIVGGRDDILKNVQRYGITRIFLAIPTAPRETQRDIINICKESGCEIKTLPGIYQLANNEVSLAKMRDVQIEDLLGRPPIVVNTESIFTNISSHVVLVTGGGGSIGSELCRQIAKHQPKQLIILDIYENNAYDIQQELRRRHPELNLTVLIGSVRDSRRMEQIFETYHPEIVFHAAAHKHVPLMEDSPCEAIKNNVLGTYKVAFAALTHGCKRFLLISTDKAVNPTNIMGASKRLCEMVIQTMDKVARTGDISILPHVDSHSGATKIAKALPANAIRTEFVAVRFGNVLGSNGSVIPLFKKQIAEGGPVTVTHPDIIRYFMTIPEAVSLVLQSATYAHGGEIFVLDMGDPMKIDSLARNLIKLAGFKPDVDIKIEYTGLRPGEKLYEEKLMSEEGLEKTENKLIHIAKPIQMDTEVFLKHLSELIEVSAANGDSIREVVLRAVPTYHPEKK
ncbi:MAG: polysaccharide biosynthesis protein [Victivallales bacterium]|nr:polysaccharide biosynthesis protein [Victivallales bacterium]